MMILLDPYNLYCFMQPVLVCSLNRPRIESVKMYKTKKKLDEIKAVDMC